MIKPILFSTPMVQALLEGRKTITRRLVKGTALSWLADFTPEFVADPENSLCPYGNAGTILWVRETFRKYYRVDEHGYTDFDREIIDYVADNPSPINEVDGDGFIVYNKDGSEKFIPFKPSIHMPKAAARIWLKVISTRAERLHDITEEDCAREGIEYVRDENGLNRYRHYDSKAGNEKYYSHAFAIDSFRSLWVSINGQESWDSNPWVFRVELEVLSTTGKPADLCE